MESRSRFAHDDLEAWARDRGIAEAYRVMREPSSHGGLVGWEVTAWRTNEEWTASRQRLYFAGPPAAGVSAGVTLDARTAAALVRAIDETRFWEPEPWAAVHGLDGYTAYFEGWREGRAVCRSAWSPEASFDHPARPLFDVFARIRPSRWRWWRRRRVP